MYREGRIFLKKMLEDAVPQTASQVRIVNAQKLVGEDTEHAQHSSAADVAFDVQLEGLGLLVIVSDPALASTNLAY